MKKLLSALLVLCLLIPAAIAEAPVDVKSMSDAELKALYKDVKTELMDRKLWDSSTLPAGVYQAGKGLPEGSYECTLLNGGMVYIYKSYQSFLNDDNIDWISMKEGQMFTMNLYGEVVYLLEFNSIVRPFVGFSW